MPKLTAAATTVLFAWLLAPDAAFADSMYDPESKIYELVQSGQDVVIQLAVPGENMSVEHDLVRLGFEDGDYLTERPLLTDYEFDEDDAVSSYGEDIQFYVFEFLDECVPPASYHYCFSTWYDSHSAKWTDVEDTGDPCLHDESGGVDSGGDCSVSGIGHDAAAGALGVLMLGLGLAGLLVSRRRR